jgi:nucleotidyltransferase/DNA polymerase involved in DNA repair
VRTAARNRRQFGVWRHQKHPRIDPARSRDGTRPLGSPRRVPNAWLLARAGSEKIITGKRAIESAIAPLPVAALECGAQTLDILDAIGARTIGDLLQLPRDGLARRCGQPLLSELDRALGIRPETASSTRLAHFSSRALGTEVASTEAFRRRRL